MVLMPQASAAYGNLIIYVVTSSGTMRSPGCGDIGMLTRLYIVESSKTGSDYGNKNTNKI
jgi:hypothetical protein